MKRLYTTLYALTLMAVCASVIVGPAVSTELQITNFLNPAATNAPSGSVTTGNTSADFIWNDATFALVGTNLLKMSMTTNCTALSDDPCDQNKDVFPATALAFVGTFSGTDFDTVADTLQLALTGTHTGMLNLSFAVVLENAGNPGETMSFPLIYSNTGSPINLSFGPVLVPYEDFLGTATLTFGEHLGSVNLGSSADTQFNFTAEEVPEPTSLALFGGGLVLLGWLRRKARTG